MTAKTVLSRKLRERAGFMREAGHHDDADLDGEVADALDEMMDQLTLARSMLVTGAKVIGDFEVEQSPLIREFDALILKYKAAP